MRAYVSALARRPQAVALRWLPGTEADATDPPGFKPLDAAMRAVLDALGATQLYRHQKEAIHAASRERRSVVVATPTASGKSLAYQVPLMATLGERRTSRAIVLFPLKALARDQLAKLRRFPRSRRAARRLRELLGRDAQAPPRHRERDRALLRRGHARARARGDPGGEDPARRDQPGLSAPLHPAELPAEVDQGVLENLRWVVLDEAHARARASPEATWRAC